MNNRTNLTLWGLVLLFAVLMSIPWLVPHAGAVALVGFLPLLFAEAIATHTKTRHFWVMHYSAFVLWNAFTTFWVCNATVGGGIFAVLANAFQMSVVFGLFRLARKRMGGVVPYIFLAAAWIAWEHFYFDAQISWPWLVLGNAFAGTTGLVQWYEWTGVLGGSLWIWLVNLGIFGMVMAFGNGLMHSWNKIARISSAAALTLVIAGPVATSLVLYHSYEEKSEASLDVVIGQPNFDPYHKFESMTQAEQTEVLLGLYEKELSTFADKDRPVLLIAPETFTSDVVLNDVPASRTIQTFKAFLGSHPQAEILFGASTYETFSTRSAPHILAFEWGNGWLESRNSAIILDPSGDYEIYHKSKLVVGTELTPYPKLFVPLDNAIGKMLGQKGPLMGRCIGQDKAAALHFRDSVALGCAVCYESVYGDFCRDYVKDGARLMTVITNDAWWGDTPGYRQHFNYSRLRAIELRRDLARCGNTGVSAIIDQRGDVVKAGPWWEPYVMKGIVNLNSEQTFFVRHGDITGRVCSLIFLLLLALTLVRLFLPKK